MIAYIQGEVMDIVYMPKQVYLVVFTAGGIAYKVFVPLNNVFNIGDEVKLFTSFQVREDSQSLYGFVTKEQNAMFENILNVSGIGPKVALAIVSNFSSSEFKKILSLADYDSLSKVPGLGVKGAKKIVLELQGIYIQDEMSSPNEAIFKELKTALHSLGFKGKELDELLKKGRDYYKDRGEEVSIENLISFVLKND